MIESLTVKLLMVESPTIETLTVSIELLTAVFELLMVAALNHLQLNHLRSNCLLCYVRRLYDPCPSRPLQFGVLQH